MSQQAVNIDELHSKILAGLKSQFPTAKVSFYPRPGEAIATPAILLDLEDIQVDDPDDVGTEQTAVTLNFNAYVVLDYKSGKKQTIKSLAASVLAYINGQRWGAAVGAAAVSGASPDKIAGREDDYEVMRVEFSHAAFLGIDVWEADQLLDANGNPSPTPDEVFVSSGVAAAISAPLEITNCDCRQT